MQELRHSVRSLLKQPGFTAVVILTLALGIGINTAVFSVVDAVLFRPLPFERSDRLMDLYQQTDSNSVSLAALPFDQIQTWRNQTDVFQSVEAHSQTQFTMTGGGEPESISAVSVTPGLFPMLGVAPALGRLFSPEEATTGNDHVVVLSDGFWKTRLGGDPAAIGKTVTLSDQRFTIVGVMPPKFKFPRNAITLWVPLVPPIVEPGKRAGYFGALARLKDGLSVEVAQSRLNALKVSLAKDRPDVSWGIKLMPLEDHRVNRRPREALLALLGAVGFVLLLSCANAANLLLARAATRQSEIAIRMAMGARRSRLVRQLLAESLVLAVVAGIVGVAFAWLGVDALARLVPSELTFMSVAKIDIDP
ncbi:MAG: ABC transporter permease, partial [Vicinamibacteria bacterium]